MKQSKDPFEAAYEEQEESPPDSPIAAHEFDAKTPPSAAAAPPSSQDAAFSQDDDDDVGVNPSDHPSTSIPMLASVAPTKSKNKEYEDEEEEDNMDVELSKFPSSSDPDKMAKMQLVFSLYSCSSSASCCSY